MTDQGKKYLSDILSAIELVEQFTESVTDFDNFLSDLKTQSAVERQLGIIGEAVNKYDQLFPESSIQNAKKTVGLRNRLIHFPQFLKHFYGLANVFSCAFFLLTNFQHQKQKS